MALPLQGNPRRWTILLVVLSALFCLVLSVLLGIYSVSRLTRLSEDLFNQRQLAQAQKIASDIQERVFDIELALLSMGDVVGSLQGRAREEKAVLVLFTQIRHFGVSEFQALDDGGRTVFSLGLAETPPDRIREMMAWAAKQIKDGTLYISQPFPLPGQSDPHRYLLIAVPTFSTSGEFNGACLVRVAADLLARRAVEGVKSGSSGYAWVIDQAGVFLAHPNPDFVGREGLQARREANPDLTYREIGRLTRDRMLRGEEGLARYEEGWHRNQSRPVKNLLAFYPVRFFDRPGIPTARPSLSPTFWSVAVVVPAQEVSGLIKEAAFREWALTGVLIVVIMISAVVAFFDALRWSSSLQSEVDRVKKDLEESQQNLIHSERLASIGKAAAVMSHEIKNPLIVIGGYVRRLADKLKDDSGSHEKLMLISGEVDRLEKMLGEVKDITRRVPLKLERGQVNGLVRGVQELLGGELENQRIDLVLKLSPEVEVGPCLLDSNQIKQVLINLLKNAAEAMPDGGRITLRTYREKEYHVVEVEDTGKGIRQEDLKEIFNPFFSTKQKGTGLGLAVSLKIVEDHCGDIRVSSEIGKGTIFKMRLPCTLPNMA